MNQITFEIKGTPIPLERARHGKGRTYDTARNKSAKEAVAWEGRAAMGSQKPFKGPVKMRVACLFEWPKSYTKSRRQRCYGNMKDTKPDLDNLVKLVKDALNGIFYDDDSQVCEITATKFFTSQEPCTRVMVEPLFDQEQPHQLSSDSKKALKRIDKAMKIAQDKKREAADHIGDD